MKDQTMKLYTALIYSISCSKPINSAVLKKSTMLILNPSHSFLIVTIPAKFRILKCNQYMIDYSDFLITYVDHSFGGAAKTLEYAKKKEFIKIFNLSSYKA